MTNRMKTPLQELIERLQELREKFDTTDEVLAVQRCIRKAHELLPYERERIETAHRDGYWNANHDDEYDKEYFDDTYYEKTYGNESTGETD